MNLSRFLKEVDDITNTMSQSDLIRFIHDAARVLPESKRTDFLCNLSKRHKKSADNKPEQEDNKHIFIKYESIKAELKRIESGKMCLVGFLNEEYDDWYNSSADEFLYEDPKGVCDIIEKACDFVHECLDCEEYIIAHRIAKILVGLQIEVGGEYQDYGDAPMAIDELSYYKLSNLDYKKLVVEAVYAAYCANELSKRADAVYRVIQNSGIGDITMEMVMQSGEELPQTEEFLKLWIAYLGNMNSAIAQKLLKEAIELTNDSKQELEIARKYCAQHPELYEQYLQNQLGKETDAELYEIGKEALKAINNKYIIRSRIALLMSQMALRLANQNAAEKCWLEAFRSDTNVVNYLRLLMECKENSGIITEAKQIYHTMCSPMKEKYSDYILNKALNENKVDGATAPLLAFFSGEFQYVKEYAMNVSDSLGWSFTFMKCGLAAFLLLLLENDGLDQGCQEMCQKVMDESRFDKEAYQKGTLKGIGDSNQDWFWKCFCRWKEMVTISDEEKQFYLKWVEKLIAKRVQGIMDGNHRKYYKECAGYIAALGEVRESRGEAGGKQKVLLEYKTLYARRRAFHEELRVVGMNDRKKK